MPVCCPPNFRRRWQWGDPSGLRFETAQVRRAPGDQLLCDPWDAHLHGGSRWGRRRRRRRLGLGGPSLRGFHSSLTLVPEVALPGRLHLCGWLEGRRRLEGGPQSRRAHQLGWPPLFATSLRGTNVSGSRMQSHLLGHSCWPQPSRQFINHQCHI